MCVKKNVIYGPFKKNPVYARTVWCIWKWRNEMAFSGRKNGAVKAFKDIRSLRFLWIKNRSVLKSTWKDWCIFYFCDVLGGGVAGLGLRLLDTCHSINHSYTSYN
ncbi:hypothetical protein Hanom_Chr01g00071441 [Helianthus anomalus]